MLGSTGSSGISNITSSNLYFPNHTERESSIQVSHTPQYDSITLSCKTEGVSRFHQEMVSRLSQEVRTAHTTGDIQRLKQQVASGQYVPEPMAIAGRMLFLTEEEG